MTLDPPTLLLALLLGFLMLALELGVAQRALPQQPELRIWTAGTWLLLLGFVAFALRPRMPAWLSVLSANAFLFLGLTLYARAIYRFVADIELPTWVWALLLMACLALVAMVPWPLNLRSSVVSFIYVALLLPSITVIVRLGWHTEASLRTVALTLALACVALMVRGVHAWYHPEQYGALTQASLGQGLTFLVTFLGVLGAGFGFVLASFERVARRMELLASHDGLTGCVNRTTTHTLLEHALLRGQREGSPLAMVMLDIDHFKQINDRFGHRTGDIVLQGFADTVRSRLRKSDVFGRVGGEEFVLLLPATDEPGAQRLAEGVREAVQAMHAPAADGQPIQVTLSGGVAVAAADSGLSAERLYALADQALYRAKHLGRNRIETVVPAGTVGPNP